MVRTFEHITRELSAEEANLLRIVAAGMDAHRGRDRAITGKEICEKVKGLTEPRLRKMVNLLRQNAVLPIIATSNGYYTATTVEEIETQIASLQDRIDAMKAAQDGLRKFVKSNTNG